LPLAALLLSGGFGWLAALLLATLLSGQASKTVAGWEYKTRCYQKAQ